MFSVDCYAGASVVRAHVIVKPWIFSTIQVPIVDIPTMCVGSFDTPSTYLASC